VTAVGSGDEAFEALQLQHYDCMVVDLKLPERSGFDLLDQISRTTAVLGHAGDRLHRARS
jgi:CheY-like chemotaxis protein